MYIYICKSVAHLLMPSSWAVLVPRPRTSPPSRTNFMDLGFGVAFSKICQTNTKAFCKMPSRTLTSHRRAGTKYEAGKVGKYPQQARFFGCQSNHAILINFALGMRMASAITDTDRPRCLGRFVHKKDRQSCKTSLLSNVKNKGSVDLPIIHSLSLRASKGVFCRS